MLLSLLENECGQDVVEYSLILALVVLASAIMFLWHGESVAGIWSVTSNNLSSASSMAN